VDRIPKCKCEAVREGLEVHKKCCSSLPWKKRRAKLKKSAKLCWTKLHNFVLLHFPNSLRHLIGFDDKKELHNYRNAEFKHFHEKIYFLGVSRFL
jgi:hypothetical protein